MVDGNLSVKVDCLNLDITKDIVALLKEILKDEQIPRDIRNKYKKELVIIRNHYKQLSQEK